MIPSFIYPAIQAGSIHPGYKGSLSPPKGIHASTDWVGYFNLYYVDLNPISYCLLHVIPKILSVCHFLLVITHNGII